MKQPRNLWPWGIILVFVLFISGTISLVVMACSQKMDLVSADYYEQEIKFQRQIDQIERTRRWVKEASVTYDSVTSRIRIALPRTAAASGPQAGAPLGKVSVGIAGQIDLYRPSAAGLDRRLRLELDRDGIQYVDASKLRHGLWKVRVSWNADNTDYFLDESVLVGG